MKIYLESLGCCRNQIDSEVMLGRLTSNGHKICPDPSEAEVIIVNTCGFIAAASAEAVETILTLAQYKNKEQSDVTNQTNSNDSEDSLSEGNCRHLVVTGCLPERFKNDTIAESMPEVDAFLGTGACDQIVETIETLESRFQKKQSNTILLLPDPCNRQFQGYPLPRHLTLDYSAFLKISEGCNRHCTYCIIPKLRGKQRSRPIDQVVEETQYLLKQGVKEIILVGENTTDYGSELTPPASLVKLLQAVSATVDKHIQTGNTNLHTATSDILSANYGDPERNSDTLTENSDILKKTLDIKSEQTDINIPKISKEAPWIRLLYTHPSSISKSTIETIAFLDNICTYFDIPVQHASSGVLKRMGRNYTLDDLYRLFATIREISPDAALRTTLITGFPGETEKDFEIMLQFIKDVRFDHLGVFPYSDSEDLASHHLKNHIPENIAEERLAILMNAQALISEEKNEKYLNQTIKVLVEENPDEGIYLGRSRFQAPEVDGLTFIYGSGLEIGQFADVYITETHEYDLAGQRSLHVQRT
ncbi:Ribosomal protein S12 methylthiotransferase RimO [Desulfamplus magnetovallimortis]|uniref:Ribosomal protein uS12 methylthiotransferase RimO n=1 Tax=Desulfamplus magnetovallimortis TaxID=1246637 RepID=A0A1W1H5H0_9BACT|nr:radical SAM protein [Desulfamplus magnetovallimortis]SLM27696.1 Ribosomal protein S12 methylthiotransferase RimO [Desulfamplus magnetovallimortis]